MVRHYKPIPPSRQRKRGPKTIMGKQRCSMNAVRHGLFARAPHIIRAQATAALREYDRLKRDFRPRSALQRRLLRLYASSTARVAWLDRWLDRHADPQTHREIAPGKRGHNSPRKLQQRWGRRIKAGIECWCRARRDETQLLHLVIWHFTCRRLPYMQMPRMMASQALE